MVRWPSVNLQNLRYQILWRKVLLFLRFNCWKYEGFHERMLLCVFFIRKYGQILCLEERKNGSYSIYYRQASDIGNWDDIFSYIFSILAFIFNFSFGRYRWKVSHCLKTVFVHCFLWLQAWYPTNFSIRKASESFQWTKLNPKYCSCRRSNDTCTLLC